jgi:hypothetical protein
MEKAGLTVLRDVNARRIYCIQSASSAVFPLGTRKITLLLIESCDEFIE